MKRADYEALRTLALAAVDEALDASNDASYRVGDWPGPDRQRREGIKALLSKILALDVKSGYTRQVDMEGKENG